MAKPARYISSSDPLSSVARATLEELVLPVTNSGSRRDWYGGGGGGGVGGGDRSGCRGTIQTDRHTACSACGGGGPAAASTHWAVSSSEWCSLPWPTNCLNPPGPLTRSARESAETAISDPSLPGPIDFVQTLAHQTLSWGRLLGPLLDPPHSPLSPPPPPPPPARFRQLLVSCYPRPHLFSLFSPPPPPPVCFF